MTEFEELALKKITRDYMIDCVYGRINSISYQYGISNSEISKHIGWDCAGLNQKFNRTNDIRITTFIKIYVALLELIHQKEDEMGLDKLHSADIKLEDLITERELSAAKLFSHISAVAEGRAEFLDSPECIQVFLGMRPFVLTSKRNKRFSDREIEVYIQYLEMCRKS